MAERGRQTEKREKERTREKKQSRYALKIPQALFLKQWMRPKYKQLNKLGFEKTDWF